MALTLCDVFNPWNICKLLCSLCCLAVLFALFGLGAKYFVDGSTPLDAEFYTLDATFWWGGALIFGFLWLVVIVLWGCQYACQRCESSRKSTQVHRYEMLPVDLRTDLESSTV